METVVAAADPPPPAAAVASGGPADTSAKRERTSTDEDLDTYCPFILLMGKRIKVDRLVDRLSVLPDNILIHHILARLPFVEAAKTSILCHRWRHLYLNTPVMEFIPKPDMFDKVENMPRPHWKRGRRGGWLKPPNHIIESEQRPLALAVMKDYADRVTRAIDCYRRIDRDGDGCSLLRFCVHFPWLVYDHVESWLNFALGEKGVEEVELATFIDPYWVCTYDFNPYNLESDFDPYNFCTKGPPPSAQIQPSLLPKLHMLKSLTLSRVPMKSENLNQLLLKCVYLERLHLERLLSRHYDVRIAGPVSRLKYVYIEDYYDCMRTGKSIVVSAPMPDLVSLRYPGFVRISPIEFAPRLIDLSIGGSHKDTEDAKFDLPSHHLFNYVSQLKSLHLHIPHHEMVKDWLPSLPDLCGLKKLTLTINCSFQTPVRVLCDIISLINAAQCLQHLTLDGFGTWFWTPVESEGETESGECADLHAKSLQVIEVLRFEGNIYQRQLVEYVVKGVASLRQLILDSRNTYKKCRHPQEKVEEWIRCELKPILPSEAKLILQHASHYNDTLI